MVKGPKKGSKRYICRKEGCERYGKIQYIQPWAGVRCKSCGSEGLEEVTPKVKVETGPPGLVQAEPAEPTGIAESEAGPPPVAPEPEDVEPSVAKSTPEPEPPKVTPKPEPRATLVKPKDGDKVRCKKCNWAVYWDSRHHKKLACHAAGCGSTDLEIMMPVEGK